MTRYLSEAAVENVRESRVQLEGIQFSHFMYVFRLDDAPVFRVGAGCPSGLSGANGCYLAFVAP